MAGETITAKKGRKDAYANVAFGTVTMSAANTLTFAQIQMGVGLFQGIAMLVHRLLFFPTPASLRELVAASDDMTVALCSSNRLASIGDVTDPAIIASIRVVSIGVDTKSYVLPLSLNFETLPGGGKLVAANPLWLAMNTSGAAAASVCRVQLDFSFIELQDRDYLELIQAQFPANIA